MKRVYFLLMFLLIIFLPLIAMSEPTPPDRELTWDQYTDPLGTGFWLYYAAESDNPRQYTDAQRIRLADIALVEVMLVDLNPPPPGGNLCFKLTAYDAQDRESDFSNEACGWFGLKKPTGLNASP